MGSMPHFLVSAKWANFPKIYIFFPQRTQTHVRSKSYQSVYVFFSRFGESW